MSAFKFMSGSCMEHTELIRSVPLSCLDQTTVIYVPVSTSAVVQNLLPVLDSHMIFTIIDLNLGRWGSQLKSR